MCPPYYNIEKYDNEFDSLDDYEIFLNTIFNIWYQNSARIFGVILREDLVSLIHESYAESYEMTFEISHLTKKSGKKFKECFYIFIKQ